MKNIAYRLNDIYEMHEKVSHYPNSPEILRHRWHSSSDMVRGLHGGQGRVARIENCDSRFIDDVLEQQERRATFGSRDQEIRRARRSQRRSLANEIAQRYRRMRERPRA